MRKRQNFWHSSPNIEILFIPPYTPEMNPIEQIWKELRARGFHNEVFLTLEKVVDCLCAIVTKVEKNQTAHRRKKNKREEFFEAVV